MEWYLKHRGKMVGPLDECQFNQLVTGAQVYSGTLVFNTRDKVWRPLRVPDELVPKDDEGEKADRLADGITEMVTETDCGLWFYKTDSNQPQGPVRDPEMLSLCKSHIVHFLTPIWDEGRRCWVRAGEYDGFRRQFPISRIRVTDSAIRTRPSRHEPDGVESVLLWISLTVAFVVIFGIVLYYSFQSTN